MGMITNRRNQQKPNKTSNQGGFLQGRSLASSLAETGQDQVKGT